MMVRSCHLTLPFCGQQQQQQRWPWPPLLAGVLEVLQLAHLIHGHGTACTQGLAQCVVHVPDMGMKNWPGRVAQTRTQ